MLFHWTYHFTLVFALPMNPDVAVRTVMAKSPKHLGWQENRRGIILASCPTNSHSNLATRASSLHDIASETPLRETEYLQCCRTN